MGGRAQPRHRPTERGRSDERTRGDRGRGRPGRYHGGARLRPRRRERSRCSSRAAASAARRTRSRATGSTPTTASTCSCAAAPRTERCSTELDATDVVTLQPRLEIAVLGARRQARTAAPLGAAAPRLHLAGCACALPLPERARARLRSPARCRACAGSIPTIRPPTPDRSATGSASTANARRVVETTWELIARPTLNLELDDASLAQAARCSSSGCFRTPPPATSATPGSRCRRSTTQLRSERSRAPASTCACAAAPRRSFPGMTASASSSAARRRSRPTLVILAVPPDRAGDAAAAGGRRRSRRFARLGTLADRQPPRRLRSTRARRAVRSRRRHAGAVAVRPHRTVPGWHAGQYLVVSLSAADEELPATVDELRERYLPALAELLPAAREASRPYVLRHPRARRHVPRELRGHARCVLRPRTELPRTGARRRSWTDTGWPATMEGAVRSGHAAADEALRAMREAPMRPGQSRSSAIAQGQMAGERV